MKNYICKFAIRFMWQKDVYADMLTHGVLLGIFADVYDLRKGSQDIQSLIRLAVPNRPTKIFYVYLGFLLFYVRLTWESKDGTVHRSTLPGNPIADSPARRLVYRLDK